MFRDAVAITYAPSCELVALCDRNEGRLRLAINRVREKTGCEIPGYRDDAFDRMITEQQPDCVIVTTPDSWHDFYICRALERGCDVITEKPMTIDEQRCQRILDTQKRTGRKCQVTFNYRYSPPRTRVKELLMSGVIGHVLSVDFHWLLDTHHGADYFRRWHRRKENSGGLLVHKATHHFDLVNWWLSAVPETVYATGRRTFYRPETAERYGLQQRTERCLDCPEARRCGFFLDLKGNASLRALYLDCEVYDGYYRDRCVFSGAIDIEDSMSVVVTYSNGATLTYSLNAFAPWEGYVIAFNGTKGRLESKVEESVYINADGTVPSALKKEGTWIRVYPHGAPAYEVPLAAAGGGHGGADPVLLRYLFDPEHQPPDPYRRAADHRAGAWSILIGVAANHSMRTGRPIRIGDLVPGLEWPDFPPMPAGREALPMPSRPT